MRCQLAHNNLGLLSFAFPFFSLTLFPIPAHPLYPFSLLDSFHVPYHLQLGLEPVHFSFYRSVIPFLPPCLWTAGVTTMSSHEAASYDFVLITCCLIFKTTHFQRDGHYIYVIRAWLCSAVGGKLKWTCHKQLRWRAIFETMLQTLKSSVKSTPCVRQLSSNHLWTQTCREGGGLNSHTCKFKHMLHIEWMRKHFLSCQLQHCCLLRWWTHPNPQCLALKNQLLITGQRDTEVRLIVV